MNAADASTVTSFDPFFATATSSAYSATYTGDPEYPIFPNPNYISRFYAIADYLSGLTHLDIDLYNACFVPSRPHTYVEARPPYKRDVSPEDETPADYTIDGPPCQHAAGLNFECKLQNTNGTFSGLQRYTDNFDKQQSCFCKKYPYFEVTRGCQKCLEMHGGIQAWHWFPDSYVNAAQDAYCGADPIEKEFYEFMLDWKVTATEADIPSTTAKNVLGTRTEVSLYYTAPAALQSAGTNTSIGSTRVERPGWKWIAAFAAVVIGGLL